MFCFFMKCKVPKADIMFVKMLKKFVQKAVYHSTLGVNMVWIYRYFLSFCSDVFSTYSSKVIASSKKWPGVTSIIRSATVSTN